MEAGGSPPPGGSRPLRPACFVEAATGASIRRSSGRLRIGVQPTPRERRADEPRSLISKPSFCRPGSNLHSPTCSHNRGPEAPHTHMPQGAQPEARHKPRQARARNRPAREHSGGDNRPRILHRQKIWGRQTSCCLRATLGRIISFSWLSPPSSRLPFPSGLTQLNSANRMPPLSD